VLLREGHIELKPRVSGEAIEDDDAKLIETMKALGYME